MLEMLPLTPLTAVYAESAGSSFGGPLAIAYPAVRARPAAASAMHVFLIVVPPGSFARQSAPLRFRPRNRRVTGVLRFIPGIPRAIAHPAHRLDARFGKPRGRELRAQPGHVNVHRAR